ncbi:MAG: hypothetical protein D6680_05590 [Cyanobacteria bacterium J007]|jgi:hypothetical protein|nr:MAG: hypothetical protein D6680_05590 [Cyanobacteria bacterium J007]
MNQPSSANDNNLILGLVKRYEFEKIKPFLISLKNCGYAGDICFVYSDLSQKTLDAIAEFGVKLIPMNEWYINVPLYQKGRWQVKKAYFYHLLVANFFPLNRLNSYLVKVVSDRLNNPIRARAQIAAKFVNMFSARYLLYYLYLSDCSQPYDNVMLTDVRDVIFQRNPFDFEIGDRLCCFLEDETKSLGSCEVNSTWLREGYGQHVLDEIGDRRISCAGTIIGSRRAILEYLETVVDNTIELKQHVWGIDQAVHNYTVQMGTLKNVVFYENFCGPVLTLHYANAEQLQFDPDGWLVNADGSIVNVLHQYDRLSPEMRQKMTVCQNSEVFEKRS